MVTKTASSSDFDNPHSPDSAYFGSQEINSETNNLDAYIDPNIDEWLQSLASEYLIPDIYS